MVDIHHVPPPFPLEVSTADSTSSWAGVQSLHKNSLLGTLQNICKTSKWAPWNLCFRTQTWQCVVAILSMKFMKIVGQVSHQRCGLRVKMMIPWVVSGHVRHVPLLAQLPRLPWEGTQIRWASARCSPVFHGGSVETNPPRGEWATFLQQTYNVTIN